MNGAHDAALAHQAGTAAWLGRPRVPGTLLIRRRLLRTLDAATRRPVTLVCAGAGWGKTALLASWSTAEMVPAPIAWLTLEPRHADPHTFWSHLLAALGASDGGPLPLCPGDEGFAPWLTERIAGLSARTVLVLDDVQVLPAGPVLDGLSRLLAGLPDQLRVVLAGRTEPDLALHRLRVEGDLTEIRRPQLAFRIPEAGDLLMMHGVPASLAQTTRLVERSEGWPVGITLMAAPDGTWPDTVRDYLMREVIDPLPPDTRDFLLRTSVAQRVCGSLAEALTRAPNAAGILEGLERANCFVSRGDGPGRQWFRYDGLLRDVLRHEADVRSPGLVTELHVRAATWYAAQGSVRDALEHAAEAGDWPFLARLVVEHALPMAVSSERAVLVGILRRIPAEHLADNADLALCAALLLFAGGDYAGVRDQLVRVGAMIDGDPAQQLAAAVMGVVVAPRMDGDMPALIEDTSRILALLGSMRMDRLPSLLQYRAITLSFKGIGLLWSGRTDLADRFLWASSAAARTAGVELVEMTAYAHLAVLVYLQGSLTEAEHYIDSVDELTRRHDLGLTVESTAAHLTRALIELERNRVSEAQDALRRGLHAAGDRPETTLSVVASMVRAQTLLATGEPVAARDLLHRCRTWLRWPLVAPLLDRWLALTEAEADLALGDHDAVIDRYAAGKVMLPAEQVMLARAYEMSGEYAAAEILLARVRESTDAVSVTTAWLVTALIADAQGHARQSADAFARAVARAETEGVRRPFHRFDNERMAALGERLQWLQEAVAPVAGDILADVIPARQAPAPAEPLSDRERDVLRYLPSVLTANEIAADLKISVNTVKAHMRSIYRKLGAARRREAVVRAHQIGLL
ncbi:helix-turn-helix transcriptional regulator [Actinoplanes sp. TBRC 11911]|uniref:LuxR C-terminal-related transcriptional regulator n=1 Tax=Actinoplanes sp. TBRC 11911 TaxID=2729386 RepID=UPI00145C86FC|nr:LuxR C-terminal-related transcriptional regulator [Actinoplanes sp. TBRC 11911]NMO52251.1 helix-turn-helix transcriptional regulator [Actinoplanes sp. TBRC 11911]